MIRFHLPFNEYWLTFWGGESAELNHHHSVASQKYAFDFIQTDDDGKFFRTAGKTNDDYLSFGADILAPATGIVVEAVNGLRDNKPGELNSFNFIGNYIMIKHSERVFSVLGHLKRDSILVKVGERVESGETIAACGNSGYSTDPHLHFHVQDSDVFARVGADYERVDVAKGQNVSFEGLFVRKNGTFLRKNNYSPVKGDVVGNKH